MSSKKSHSHHSSSSQVSGKKHKQPEPTPVEDDDDADFHDLPKEQPKKKQKKSNTATPTAHVPDLDPTAHKPVAKKVAPPPPQPKAAAASSSKRPVATVPVMGAPAVGDDDEEMDEGASDEGGDSDAEGTQQKEVKVMTKTEAKAARVWDRPAVSAASLLPNPQARTPSHIAPTSSSKSNTTTPASAHILAPMEAAATSSIASAALPAQRKVIIVLVKASLETVKTKKGYELISADSHKHILQKLKKNPSEYRPDILHQCLLTLLDSPLNKAGLLEVYVETEKHVLIEVHSSIRIPRTFKRFAGLMVQLLHKLKIRSSDSSDMLLKVIRNPVTDHLPIGSLKIGTSVTGDLVDIRELASNVIGANPTAPVVFCVGSHASGPADVNWTDKSIAISKYPLSASVALGRICNAFEGIWNVL